MTLKVEGSHQHFLGAGTGTPGGRACPTLPPQGCQHRLLPAQFAWAREYTYIDALPWATQGLLNMFPLSPVGYHHHTRLPKQCHNSFPVTYKVVTIKHNKYTHHQVSVNQLTASMGLVMLHNCFPSLPWKATHASHHCLTVCLNTHNETELVGCLRASHCHCQLHSLRGHWELGKVSRLSLSLKNTHRHTHTHILKAYREVTQLFGTSITPPQPGFSASRGRGVSRASKASMVTPTNKRRFPAVVCAEDTQPLSGSHVSLYISGNMEVRRGGTHTHNTQPVTQFLSLTTHHHHHRWWHTGWHTITQGTPT